MAKTLAPVVTKTRLLGKRHPHFTASMGDALQATGSTAAEASEAVVADAMRALTGPYTGRLVEVGDTRMLVMRDPLGWRIDRVNADGTLGCSYASSEGRDETIARAWQHAAQGAYDPATEWNGADALAETAGGYGVPDDVRADFLAWCAFQIEYRVAAAAGADDPTAHRTACERMHETARVHRGERAAVQS